MKLQLAPYLHGVFIYLTRITVPSLTEQIKFALSFSSIGVELVNMITYIKPECVRRQAVIVMHNIDIGVHLQVCMRGRELASESNYCADNQPWNKKQSLNYVCFCCGDSFFANKSIK